MKTRPIILIIIGVAVVITAGFFIWRYQKTPGKLDAFAQCISQKGAKFYGASWCSRCQDQKKLFGKSVKLLPYVECSTPDGQSQLPVCNNAQVESYPTWVFSADVRQIGLLSLDELAQKTGCQLP